MPPLFNPSGAYFRFISLALVLLACQLFDFPVREAIDATSTRDAQATIAALVTANQQLSIQVATVDAQLQVALYTATPTPTASPTPLPPSPTPSQTPSPTPYRAATSAPVYAPTPTSTPTPKTDGWVVQNIFFSQKRPNWLFAFQKKQPDLDYRLMGTGSFGQSWTLISNRWPVEAACINSLTLDNHNPEYFYLSTCQGIYHWSGMDWILKFNRPAGAVANIPEQPQLLWVAEPFGPTEIPVYRNFSSQTWTPASRYLSHTNGVATLLVDPTDAERLYAVIWPDGSGSYLRRGSANGQWLTLPTPLNNSPIDTGLAINGLTRALYVVSDGHQLWRSPNPNSPQPEFIQWDLEHHFDNNQHVTLLGAAWPNNQLLLFVNIAPKDQDALAEPYYSADGGITWKSAQID